MRGDAAARWRGGLAVVMLVLADPGGADGLPACLATGAEQTIEEAFGTAGIPESEVLARLAYAEGRSTGFADDPLVYRGIAWGVMNRVRLAAASPSMRRQFGSGIRGLGAVTPLGGLAFLGAWAALAYAAWRN